MPSRQGSVDPSKHPNEVFELYSIPAYDGGSPVQTIGRDIGSAKQIVQEGDVLLSRIVPHIRRAWIVGGGNGHRKIGSGEWIVFNGPDLFPGYIQHILLTDRFNAQLMKTIAGVGGSLLRARPSSVARITIPVPPLEEQKRIAAILDKADDIRRKREHTIELADDFLRSLFLDMFGDPIRNPKGWPRRRIRDIGTVVTGNTPPRDNSEFYGGEIEWIKSDNINNSLHLASRSTEFLSQAARHKARIVPPGSLLVTCIAGSYECIGNLALVDREVAFNQQINAIIPNASTDSIFLYVQCLLAKRLIQEASTASMKGMVSKGRFQELFLPSPPEHNQKEFNKLFSRWSHIRHSDVHHETATLAKCFSNLVFKSE